MGPVVLRSIARGIHEAGGRLDCHLMVDDPAHHIEEFASSGADSVTFHVEVRPTPPGRGAGARARPRVGIAFNPETTPARAAEVAVEAAADIVLCMSIHPGYSGQSFMPEAFGRIEELATLVEVPIQVDGGVGEANVRALREAGASLLVAGSSVFSADDPAEAYRGSRRGGMSLERALELAAAHAGRGYPNPTVGAVVVAPRARRSARASASLPVGRTRSRSRSTPRATRPAAGRSS